MKTLLRKFRDEQLGEVSEIEAWVVKWKSTNLTGFHSAWAGECRAFFATKSEADRLARAIRDAHKLLRNNKELSKVKVEKHK